uniref:Uncharacterized protein n=1 Tax=Talaromyces marneffei PM1 TaxID=1077442 RepID=A0A093VJQ9_TALMA
MHSDNHYLGTNLFFLISIYLPIQDLSTMGTSSRRPGPVRRLLCRGVGARDFGLGYRHYRINVTNAYRAFSFSIHQDCLHGRSKEPVQDSNFGKNQIWRLRLHWSHKLRISLVFMLGLV